MNGSTEQKTSYIMFNCHSPTRLERQVAECSCINYCKHCVIAQTQYEVLRMVEKALSEKGFTVLYNEVPF